MLSWSSKSPFPLINGLIKKEKELWNFFFFQFRKISCASYNLFFNTYPHSFSRHQLIYQLWYRPFNFLPYHNPWNFIIHYHDFHLFFPVFERKEFNLHPEMSFEAYPINPDFYRVHPNCYRVPSRPDFSRYSLDFFSSCHPPKNWAEATLKKIRQQPGKIRVRRHPRKIRVQIKRARGSVQFSHSPV